MEVISDFVPVVRSEITSKMFGVLNLSPKGEHLDKKRGPVLAAGLWTPKFVTDVLAPKLDPLGRVLMKSLDYLSLKDEHPRAAYALGFSLVTAPLYAQEGSNFEMVVLNFSSGDQGSIYEEIKRQKPRYEWPDAFYDAYNPVPPLPERQPHLRDLVAIASQHAIIPRYTHLVRAAALGLYNGLALVYPESTEKLLPVDANKEVMKDRLQEWEKLQKGFDEYIAPEGSQASKGSDLE